MTIEKISTLSKRWSWQSRYLNFVLTVKYMSVFLNRDKSRLFRFLWISWFFLVLDWEKLAFYKYLNQDFSSKHFLFTFLLQNGQKVWEIQTFVTKMQKKFKKSWKKLRNLEKSQQILKNMISLESLDNLNKYLDAD